MIVDCTFEGNSATFGAGLFNGGTTTITGGVFRENTAFGNGGGIDNIGTISADGTSFEFNDANLGGGLHSFGGFVGFPGTTDLSGCTFLGNSASESGGGIHIDQAATGTVTDCTFESNMATFGAGLFNAGTTTITGGRFAPTRPLATAVESTTSARSQSTTHSSKATLLSAAAADSTRSGALWDCRGR